MRLSNPIFIPGPTNIPEEIRRSIELPTVDHRNPTFQKSIRKLASDIGKVLKSSNSEVFVFPATGTGGWEAAIANTLNPGDRILACRHGVFSNKWIDLCINFGLKVDIIECDWRGPAQPALIEKALRQDSAHEIKAVLATHNETATGVVSDLKAIRNAIDNAGHSALFFVDGVSSIASMNFEMDAWKVDIAVTGSQKGFMLPAGLAVVACSQKAMDFVRASELPKFFFDFKQMSGAIKSGGYPYTPPMQLLAGMQKACDMLLGEGIDRVVQRHYHIAEGVRRAVKAWGMEICANSQICASDSVTTIMLPEGFNSDHLVSRAYSRYAISYGVGLGKFAGKSFRIGHLGQLTEAQILAGLAIIEMAMLDLGIPIEVGSGVAAAQKWYSSSDYKFTLDQTGMAA